MEVAKTWFVLGAGQAKTLMPTLHTLTGTKADHNRQKWPNLCFQQVKTPGSLRYSKRVCNKLKKKKKKKRHSERPPEGEVFVYTTGRSGQNGA